MLHSSLDAHEGEGTLTGKMNMEVSGWILEPPASEAGAAHSVLVHKRPSGDHRPSKGDVDVSHQRGKVSSASAFTITLSSAMSPTSKSHSTRINFNCTL